MEESVKEEGGNYFAKQVGGNENRDGRGRAAPPCWRLGLEYDFWADFKETSCIKFPIQGNKTRHDYCVPKVFTVEFL